VSGRPEQGFGIGSNPTLVYYATRSGGTTLDTGEGGGNPFATALIEVASEGELELRNLATRLREVTAAKSCGHQIVECFGHTGLPAWRIRDDLAAKRERRSALVLVVSDYSLLGPNASLLGAARDERRIAAMLAEHGFSVDQGIGPRREELTRALVSFKRRSRNSDISVIYSTGHGIEVGGVVYLLSGDYPVQNGFEITQLRRHAVSVPHLISATSASKQNLVFFAGCRTHVRNDRAAGVDESWRPCG
jgi:hypothetical protein